MRLDMTPEEFENTLNDIHNDAQRAQQNALFLGVAIGVGATVLVQKFRSIKQKTTKK